MYLDLISFMVGSLKLRYFSDIFLLFGCGVSRCKEANGGGIYLGDSVGGAGSNIDNHHRQKFSKLLNQ